MKATSAHLSNHFVRLSILDSNISSLAPFWRYLLLKPFSDPTSQQSNKSLILSPSNWEN